MALSSTDVRKGVTQSKANEQGLFFISVDAAAIGGLVWYSTSQWALGIVGFVVAMLVIIGLAQNQKLSAVASLCGGLIWGYVAYKLAIALEASSQSAAIVAGVAGLLSVGGHAMGLQHVADL